MEAVASASAIMAVVEIAFSVSKALATYATAVKGAPKRSRDLREEARLLSEALKTVRQKTTSWHHSEVSAVKGMMHAIDEVTSILKELESRMHVSKGDIFGRLAWPFTESETNKYLEKFQRYNTSFQLILRSLDRTTLESIEYTGQVTDRKVTDMYTIALDTSGKAREETRLKILHWLWSGDDGRRHRTISAVRMERSGRWLLESSTYKEWMAAKGSDVFACHGHGKIRLDFVFTRAAGVGKTVLASLVIDEIAESLEYQDVSVVHLYFDYKDSDNQTPDCVLRRLIKQLLIPLDLVPRDLETLYDGHRRRLRLPDIDAMIRIWDSLSMNSSGVFAVFDGIDECSGRAQRELLDLINKLRRPNVKIFCTFRSHVLTAVTQQLNDCVHVQKVEAHGEDIKNYISHRLNSEWQHHLGLIPKIVDPLAEKATGQSVPSDVINLTEIRFLLVKYQLDNILSFSDPRAALKALDNLPTELEGAYHDIMQRIERGHESPALKILSWLFHTKRPMKMHELREALSVQTGDRELKRMYFMNPATIVQCCQSLVELDEASDVVEFAHLTIHEFLKNEYQNTLHTPIELGRVCLTYLNFDALAHPCPTAEAFLERLQIHEFFDYAVSHSGLYIKGPGECDPQTVQQLVQFLRSPQRCSAYLQDVYKLREFVLPEDLEGTTALHIVSTMGLADFYRLGREVASSEVYEVLHGVDVDALTCGLTTALMFASASGHLEMTLALIEAGANVNLENEHGATAIVHASIQGHLEVAVELMNHGADPMVSTESFGTPLEIASLLGHQKLVQTYLERIAFETSPTLIVQALRMALSYESNEKAAQQARLDKEEGTAHFFLTIFSSSEHKEVERTLLAHCKDSSLIKANPDLLHLAVENEHSDIVLRLLESEVDVEVRNSKGETPLLVAASLGNDEIVLALLTKGANIEVQDDERLTAIHHAVRGGRVDILSALLMPYTDLDAPDDGGWTPLHYAARDGNDEIVSLLLDKGGDITAQTNHSVTPLHLAAYSGNVDTAKLLLSAGAPIDAAGDGLMTPFLAAAMMGHVETLLALVERGAHLFAKDQEGKNAVHHAAATTESELVEMLLDWGFDLETWDGQGMTPLLHAAKAGCIDTVSMLLQKGADWTTLDHNGMTALHYAAMSGNIDCIKALMATGIDVNLRDAFDQTALAKAALAEDRDAVVFLMEGNAAVQAGPDGDLPLLHMMASAGKTELVLRLLQANFDVNRRDKNGETALMKAAEGGYNDLVETLMQYGADGDVQDNDGTTALMKSVTNASQVLIDRTNLNAQDHDGYTALHEAVSINQETLTRLLLDKRAEISPITQQGFTPLHIAAAKGFIDLVKLLMKRGANPQLLDEDGWTVLHFAVQNGHSDVMTEVLSREPSLVSVADYTGRTALHLAASAGYRKAMKTLLSHGAELGCRDDQGWTALHSAASRGRRLAIIELVQGGVDVDCPDCLERTALHIAAGNDQIQSAKELLALHANIDAADANGNTPLYEAAINGNTEMVKFCIDGGADLEVQSILGSGILHAAVYGNSLSVLSVLLHQCLNVDAEDSDGLTPLHLATRSGKCEIAVALLSANANVESQDHLGRTPLHLAATEGNVDMLTTLIERGASLQTYSREGLRPLSHAFKAYQVDAMFFLLQRMLRDSNNDETIQSPEDQDDRQRTRIEKKEDESMPEPTETVRDGHEGYETYRKYTERLGCELWNDGLTVEASFAFDDVVDSDAYNIGAGSIAEILHVNVQCCICRREIAGIRYRCSRCELYDVCSDCYRNGRVQKHESKHSFVRIPSDLWYPGNI